MKNKGGIRLASPFLIAWTIATSLGLALGLLVSIGFYFLDYIARATPSLNAYWVQQPLRAVLHIVPMAVLQAWVLRRWRVPVRGWALLTLTGFALYGGVTTFAKTRISYFAGASYFPNQLSMGLFLSEDAYRGLNPTCYSKDQDLARLNACHDAFQAKRGAIANELDRPHSGPSFPIEYTPFDYYIPLLTDDVLPAAIAGLCVGLMQSLAFQSGFIRRRVWVGLCLTMFCLCVSIASSIFVTLDQSLRLDLEGFWE